MGVIRGGLLVIVSAVLFIVVLLGSIFYVLSFSLGYENVQKELGEVAKNITEGKFNLIGENFDLTREMKIAQDRMIQVCQNETSYVFASGGYTFVLPCSLLEEENQSPGVFIDSGIDRIIYHIYYDDYDCNFWDCVQKTRYPLFLVSEKARNYWQEKFYLALIVFAVLAVLVFLLVEQKQNTPLVIGSTFVVSSLLLSRIEKIPVLFIGEDYSQFVRVFFSETSTVFWILLVSGIILIIAGISLRILGTDFMKKKFSEEDVKEIVREEAGKKIEEKLRPGLAKVEEKKPKKNMKK